MQIKDKKNIAEYALTFDLDWAPDYAINFVSNYLIENKIKSTWFITHLSPAIERLKLYPELFELGLHPNFLSNSSHGKTDEEVMTTITNMVNGSVIRTHCLVQSSPLLALMARNYGVQIDCSLFLPGSSNITPHKIFLEETTSLFRIPYFWEDDHECYDPNQSWIFTDEKYHVEGLKIFNFHPTYIYLNCCDMKNYKELKQLGHLPEIPEEVMKDYVNTGNGAMDIFKDYVRFIREENKIQMNMTDIVKNYF